MDPLRNPFAPGAGNQPPELAGRDELLVTMRTALGRVRLGRHAKSMLLIGLRGVGKTVLLDRIREEAESAGLSTLRMEAPEGRSLPALLSPQLRLALLTLSRVEKARELANRALRGLAGFARALKVKHKDIEVALDLDPEPGLADNGDLEADLPVLLSVVGEAAKRAGTVLALFIDELQYVEEDQLAALITALHACAQRALPVVLVGAGLPQLRAQAGRAKSYAERLFDFPEIGPLEREAAHDAIAKPIRQERAGVTPEALDAIFRRTQGYPYFLQEWGKHAWDVAVGPIITSEDVDQASTLAMAQLDHGFFLVRFDRLSPMEKRYLRAMAELGPGPHRSGDVAGLLGRKVSTVAPTRAQLVAKGMVWSPSHGDTAFTVPLMDGFLRRIMPL